MLSLLLTLGALAPASDAAAVPAGGTLAFRAARVHVGDGRVVENGVVIVRDGVVREVGPNVKVPEGMHVVEHDGDLTAGMVALHDHSVPEGEASDSTRAFLAEAELAYAFDPDSAHLRRAAAAGITTLVLAPTPENVAGGVTAVVKTAGGRLLKRRGHLALSMCGEALRDNRFPTSYPGLLGALEERFTAGEGAWGEARAGSLPVLVEVRSRADALRAIELAKRHGLRGALSGAERIGEVADAVKASGMGVVLPAADLGQSEHVMLSARALAEAGVPFGFALDAPARSPLCLRLGAAQCVRAGLEPAAAWQALTAQAAAIAGVGDKIGRVASGMDADLVLWSGKPLDLGSRIEAVYVDGRRVAGAGEEQE